MQSYTSLRYILSFLWYTLGSVQAFTYWIDSSCYDKLHYTVIPEAVEFYSSANYRMHLMTDRNQETAFNLLFKVPYLDAASYNEVNRITAGVAGFTLIDERPNSDLRVYCDNDEEGPDKRWRPVPDILDLPEGVVPNSQRTYGVDQEMYDHINGFRAEINRNEKLGCQVEGVFAITYLNLRDKVGENENRTILTICDETLETDVQSFERDLVSKQDIRNHIKDFSGRNINAFEALTSFLVAHELTHYRKFDTDDVMGGSDSYGWRNVVNRDLFNNTDSLKNAENYAYFGLCAILADRNWRLPNDINEARKGRLVYDEDIPHK